MIKPSLVGDLTYGNTTIGSYYGTMVSNWSRTGTTGNFHFEIPVNTTAIVYIPAQNIKDVLESGKPATKTNGVTYLGKDGINVVFFVDSGAYDFASSSVPQANNEGETPE
ncbi:MAG: hypothetical protein K9M57_04620 [Phycisphaerae bacterium]|nr:hypothetical protein [Phycisphaerae bacterium]